MRTKSLKSFICNETRFIFLCPQLFAFGSIRCGAALLALAELRSSAGLNTRGDDRVARVK